MSTSLTSRLPLRIGTRGSKLALAQTDLVIDQLRRLCPGLGAAPELIERVIIKTSGDLTQATDQPLSVAGNKGLRTKEIEEALLDGRIDIAVHSMKDLPTVLPDGLILAATPPREDVRDVFLSAKAKHLDDLPPGAVVGTASLRRQALVLARRPDLKVVPFRGNADTRVKKLEEGQVDATLLAAAGLNRIQLQHKITALLEPEVMLPAVAQGALGLEIRADDSFVRELLGYISCHDTWLQITAERALLAELDGSCKTPIAALAITKDDELWLRALVARPNGSEVVHAEIRGRKDEALRLGVEVGRELKGRTPADFFRH